MQEEEILRKAKRRVKAIKGFYIHLGTYLGTIVFLFILNFLTDPYEWWAVYPAAGWGLGLFFHYMGVFGLSGIGGKDWEERALEREVEKLRHKNGLAPKDDPETLDLDEDELELKEKIPQKRDYNDQDLV